MATMRKTGPLKSEAATRMRKTAESLDAMHPEMITGDHVRDAAKMLQAGHTDAAKRHLDAAIELLTPRNLIRHGIRDDEGHAVAKHHMHRVHQHRLHVQDIEDVHGRNERFRAVARARRTGQPEPDENLQREPVTLAWWTREPRDPGGRWMKAGSLSAAALHGQRVTGLTRKGQQVHGTYDHHAGHVILRHGSGTPVSHVKLGQPETVPVLTGRQRKKPRLTWAAASQGFTSWDGVTRAVELAASPAARAFTEAWMTEARDPHTGKWIKGPADISNVRIHMEGQHGFGHSLGHLSAEELLERHDLLHQEPQFRNPVGGHHHVVTGGGAGSEYGRLRAAREAQAAALTVPESMLPNLGYAGHHPALSDPYRGLAESYSNWDQVCRAIELSARTPMLERTPAPRGRPGGPGLYRQKGMGHTPYLQQVVRALIEERGMTSDKAYAIARARIRKWAATSRHPEVRAAAGRAEAGELAKQARAKASHGHASDWEQVCALLDLAMVREGGGGAGRRTQPRQGQRQRPQSSNWQGEQRVPKGQFGGGRFSKGGGGQAQKRKPGAGKGMAGKTAGSRARLRVLATSLRSQIAALEAQLPRTSRGKKSKSSTPAKKGAAATSAKQAQQTKQAKAQATRAAKTATAAHKQGMSVTTIHAKIAALRAQLVSVEARLR